MSQVVRLDKVAYPFPQTILGVDNNGNSVKIENGKFVTLLPELLDYDVVPGVNVIDAERGIVALHHTPPVPKPTKELEQNFLLQKEKYGRAYILGIGDIITIAGTNIENESGFEIGAELGVSANGDIQIGKGQAIPFKLRVLDTTSLEGIKAVVLRVEESAMATSFGGEMDANLVNSAGVFGFNGDVTIPNELDGTSVTSIGDGVFAGTGLTSVTLPNGLISIGDSAFAECSRLTSVTIPNGVTNIGDHAFYYCTRLTSVTIPNSVTSIGDGAFADCINLTSVTIPNGVIGSYAFADCTGLTSVTIESGVTSIGDGAFADCFNLAIAYLPAGLTYSPDTFPQTTDIIKYTPGGADDPTIEQ